MDILVGILELVGSLAFFLYGMKLMSEALQKVAGDKMRNILGAMTSNRFKGVLTGVLITAIIQSSSATTVMVVSFVNAGLLSLVQSIGVIMGANIGTTVTAWLISLLGFKVKVSAFALPLLGLGIPFIFSKKSRNNSIGQVIVGFAILFMGLAFLKDAVPDIEGNSKILEFIAQYSSYGFFSILIFMISGTFLTMVIQSSSAVMALTLVMCFNGWINFDMAAAMVLGENIGTTITANIAALVVNHTAKRAARAHLLFNVTGVVLVVLLFRPFLGLVDWILVTMGQDSPLMATDNSNNGHFILTIGLSVFHTTFNVFNTLLQVWFVPYIEKIVIWMVPAKGDDDDEVFKLKYISTKLVSVDEIGLLQAKKEIGHFSNRTIRMYTMVKQLIADPNGKKAEKLIGKIKKYEEISDKFEDEITSFLTKSSNELSKSSSEKATVMLKLVNRIESLNDACNNVAELVYSKRNKLEDFTPEMNMQLQSLLSMIDEHTLQLPDISGETEGQVPTDAGRAHRDDIDTMVEKMNLQHLKDIKKGVYKYKVGIIYCDIFTELGVVGNHAYHVHKYINELNS